MTPQGEVLSRSEGIEEKVRTPREVEEDFVISIDRIFESVGDDESIGSAIKSIATEAFNEGIGKDQLVRVLKSPIVLRAGGSLRNALKRCIGAQIKDAYYSQPGRREMEKSEKTIAEDFLHRELVKMDAHDTVSNIFRKLLEGAAEGFYPLQGIPSKTISRKNFSAWAQSNETLNPIVQRFAHLMGRTAEKEYTHLINEHPDTYLVTFLPYVIKIDKSNNAHIVPTNLHNLMEDIYPSLELEDFIGLVEAFLASQDVGNIDSIVDTIKKRWEGLYGSSDEEPKEGKRKKKSKEKESSKKKTYKKNTLHRRGGEIRRITTDVRERSFDLAKIIGRVEPVSGAKLNVAVMSSSNGETITRIPVKTNTAQNPTELTRYIEEALTGRQSKTRAELLRAGIRIAPEGPEIEEIVQTVQNSVKHLKATNGVSHKARRKKNGSRR